MKTPEEILNMSEEEWQDYLDEGYCDTHAKQIEDFTRHLLTKIETEIALQYDTYPERIEASETFRKWFFRGEAFGKLDEAVFAALSKKRILKPWEE